MSRSGYSEDCDGWDLIRWRGAVASAIRGNRGQAFLREMLDALKALPNKRLIARELESNEGEVCALGAVARTRGLDIKGIDPEDGETVAEKFGIARALAQEIVFENDEDYSWNQCTPEERYSRMVSWIEQNLKPVQNLT